MNPVGCICPLYLGLLEIEDSATQHAATRKREIHNEAIHTFRKTIDVQKTLTRKIVQVIDTKYIYTLRDRTTNKIVVDIQTLLAYLVRGYGVVEADTLGNREQKVRKL